jgi:hypothetical protein
VVSTCLIPRLVQAPVHKAEVNWTSLSVLIVAGTPKCATQLVMKASVHVMASMLLRRTASTHLVDLLMMVNRYTWPLEESGLPGPRARGRTCTPAWGWREEELQAACGPSPAGFAGSPSTSLQRPWPTTSTRNLQSPCVRWHICQNVPH